MISSKENRCSSHGHQGILYSLPAPGIQGERAIGTFFLIIRVCSRYFYVSHHFPLCTSHTCEKAVSLLPEPVILFYINTLGVTIIVIRDALQKYRLHDTINVHGPYF